MPGRGCGLENAQVLPGFRHDYEGACFVLFHHGHLVALSDGGILRNYLCLAGEHQGLARTARRAPSNTKASWECQASAYLLLKGQGLP